MSATTWGMLAKSQDDPETIEEAIARIVAEHNADEESHLATGQSLQSHKASDIIDHLALSIVNDKLERGAISFDKFNPLDIGGIINFDTVDRWIFYGASQTVYLGKLVVRGASPVNSVSRARLVQLFPNGFIEKTRDWFLNFDFEINSNRTGDVWFGAGDIYEPWDVIEAFFFGFKWTGSVLYAYWITYDSVLDVMEENTYSLGAISPYTKRNYEISFNATTKILTWKINNVSVHTEDMTSEEVESGGLCAFLNKNTSGFAENMNIFPITFGSKAV